MSDAQDPATIPAVGTQVKLRGWSRQGEGGESFHFRRHEELQAFLSLLGESTWGLARQGPWGPSVNRCGRWDLSLQPLSLLSSGGPSLAGGECHVRKWVQGRLGLWNGYCPSYLVCVGVVTPVHRFSSLPPEHSFLQDFLSKDPCFQISDKVRGHSGGRGQPRLGKIELVGLRCC